YNRFPACRYRPTPLYSPHKYLRSWSSISPGWLRQTWWRNQWRLFEPTSRGHTREPGPAIHIAPTVSTSVAMPVRSTSRIQRYRAWAELNILLPLITGHFGAVKGLWEGAAINPHTEGTELQKENVALG